MEELKIPASTLETDSVDLTCGICILKKHMQVTIHEYSWYTYLASGSVLSTWDISENRAGQIAACMALTAQRGQNYRAKQSVVLHIPPEVLCFFFGFFLPDPLFSSFLTVTLKFDSSLVTCTPSCLDLFLVPKTPLLPSLISSIGFPSHGMWNRRLPQAVQLCATCLSFHASLVLSIKCS